MEQFIEPVRVVVKRQMERLAVILNRLSKGRLRPAHVTLTGLIMHLPIAWLIATGHWYWAALLLVVFGLFDALDGALARLQGSADAAGMLLDASTDRMKEVLLYCGVAWALLQSADPGMAVWAVAACGASLCVSYIKAKGETAIKDLNVSANQINRLFADGVMRFEIRMTLLIAGLLMGYLSGVVAVIAIGSAVTAIGRLQKITKYLRAHAKS